MTTPKCVFAVLSSGALGGTEMTGGLDGFLLEVMVFSGGEERRDIRKQRHGCRIQSLQLSVCKRTFSRKKTADAVDRLKQNLSIHSV